ncbi:MAG: phosphoribosylaminoimidazolesuccinocarboxamide synthase [Candidatus Omnitrophota bacterium]
MSAGVLLSTDFKDLRLFKRGKVRDVYDLDEELLIVATDRISCFDVVLPSGIPHKGEILTAISRFWFDFIKDIVPTHFITSDANNYPGALKSHKEELLSRSMLVKKTRPIPVECIVRGYLSGSGWKEYEQRQSVSGIRLPAGLAESAKLPQTIFTPSTKADTGHDVNVTQDSVEKELGNETADKLKRLSIAIYEKASSYALARGIIIADTKFEFGWHNGELMLIDEALTPDSSRFWPKSQYAPGRSQPSFDKQFVRDYLESINWNKTPPAPELPQEIIEKTSQKYKQAFKMLTVREL